MENSRKIVRQIVYNFIPCLLRAEWPGRLASRLSNEGAYNSWRRSKYLKILIYIMLLNYDGLNRSKNAKNKGEQKNISKEHVEKNYACQSYNLKALIRFNLLQNWNRS